MDEYKNEANTTASNLSDMRGADRAVTPMAGRASREKTWDECPIEEKLERLRRELRDQRETFQYVARTATQAQSTAERHQHNQNTGEVLTSPRQGSGGMMGDGRGFDPLR